MSKLKAKINKTDFDSLSESIQELYLVSGEDYILDAEGVEDVTGLKNKITELLKDGKSKAELLKAFEGLDPEAAKKALEEMTKFEEKKLADKGKYDELLGKHKTEFETKLAASAKAQETTIANLKREKLMNFLVQNGVIADRAKYALADVESLIDLAEGESGFELKSKDASELTSVIETLKTSSGFLFSPSGASGSGASGSDTSGGTAKQLTRTSFDALSPQQQSEFSISGGAITD